MRRTSVVLDETKLRIAKKVFEIHTTKELLDFALSELIKTHNRKKILDLKGKVKIDIALDELRKTG